MADMRDEKTTLEEVKQWYETAEDLTIDARETAEQCRDYYDNDQWSEAEKAALKKRNQPIVTKNRIKPKIDFLLGMERQMRTDPRAAPRTDKDVDASRAATETMRYACDKTDFSQERSKVFENILIEGTGGADCTVEQSKDGKFEIKVRHLSWDRIWFDPYSRRHDFDDAKYIGWVMWMDKADALEQWPDAEDMLEDMLAAASTTTTYDDAPRVQWANSKRNRVKVAGAWYRKGGNWYRCVFTGAGFLEWPELSPWVDAQGDTEPGLFLQSAFVTRENDRYGVVFPLLSLQDAINFRESRALHLLSVRQTWGAKNMGLDAKTIKRELSRADGHIELPAGGKLGENFGLLDTGDMAQAQFQLLQEAKAEIDAVGAAAALSGKGDATSGRELIARQQGGQMELGPVFDGLRMWQHRVYRWMWNRIQQFWDAPMMVRVTDDPRNVRFVEVNKPITVRDAMMEEGQEIPPILANDPRLNAVIGVKNNLAELDVDIIIDDAPDTTTLVGEQFEQLVNLANANPGLIPPELIIEASELKDKERLLEMLEEKKRADAEMQMNNAQVAQAGQAAEIQQITAKTENLNADTEKKRSETMENMQQARMQGAEAFASGMMQGM